MNKNNNNNSQERAEIEAEYKYFKEKVKEAASLEEVFASHGVTGPENSNWNCPFHQENTGSMQINRDKDGDWFFCYGCEAKGDAIDAEKMLSGLDFQPALFNLADQFGVQVPPKVKRPDFSNVEKKEFKPRTPIISAKEKSNQGKTNDVVKREYILHYDYLTPDKTLLLRVPRMWAYYEDGQKKKTFWQRRPATEKEIKENCTYNPTTGELLTKRRKAKEADGNYKKHPDTGRVILEDIPQPLAYIFKVDKPWAENIKWAGKTTGFVLNWSYNAPKWYKSGNKVLFATEGEKDADFLQADGYNTTCSPAGAKTYTSVPAIKNMIAGGIEEVIHFADSDIPGLKYILQEMRNFEKAGIQYQKFVILDRFRDISLKHGNDVFDKLSEQDHAVREIELDKLVNGAFEFTERTEKRLVKVIELLRKKLDPKYVPEPSKSPPITFKEPCKNLKEKYDETDTGNVEILYDIHGKNIRYIGGDEMKKFAVWNELPEGGGHWHFVDDTDLMKFTVDVYEWRKSFASNLPTKHKKEEIQIELKKAKGRSYAFAMSSQNYNKRLYMIKLLKGDDRIRSKITDFDINPFLLNCANGTYNLKSHTFKKADRQDYCMKVTKVEYKPRAKCKLFRSVLDTAMTITKAGQKSVEKSRVNLIQRWFGYSACGNVGEEVMAVFYGPKGRNGKTKICEAVMHVLGDYADVAPSDLLVQKDREGIPTDLADLQGRRCVVISEPEENSKLAVSKMKLLVGGDTIKCRRMFKDYYKFTPTHKLTLLTNGKPRINSIEPHIWDKIMLISFFYHIPTSQRDKNLSKKLEKEGSGILNWIIEGFKNWEKEGLNPPKSVTDQGDKWKHEEDVLADFIEDELEEVKENIKQQKNRIPKKALYAAYMDYCKGYNRKYYGDSYFGKLLRDRGWQSGRSGSVRYWAGWRLKTKDEKDHEIKEAMEDGFQVDIKGLETPGDEKGI